MDGDFFFFSLLPFFHSLGERFSQKKNWLQANSIIYRNIVQNFLPARILISFLSGILILLMLFILVFLSSISPRIIFIFLVPFFFLRNPRFFTSGLLWGVSYSIFLFLSVVEQTSFLFSLIVFSFSVNFRCFLFFFPPFFFWAHNFLWTFFFWN